MEFLNRARRLVKGQSPTEPPGLHFYVVTCPEGHRLRGQRTEGYQALRCPTCGGGVFVLPRSPLPHPVAPPESRRRAIAPPLPEVDDDAPIEYVDAPSPSNDFSDEVEIQWLDDPGTQPPSLEERVSALRDEDIPPEYLEPPAPEAPPPADAPAPGRPARRSRRRAAAASPRVKAPESVAASPDASDGVAAPEARSILVPAGRGRGWLARNRVALLLAGILTVAGATVAYRLHRHRLEQLPQVAETNYEEGIEALDRGEFDVARQKLSRATASFKELGSLDERSEPALQLSREAAIYADLCPRSLEELIDEAGRSEPADWPSVFEVKYQGRAIIVDDVLGDTPAGSGSAESASQLSYRILVGRGPHAVRTGRIDLSGFQLFADRDRAPGEPVLFGARLESITLEGNEWIVRLAPESGVLLSRFEPLELLGWTPRATHEVTAANDAAQPSRRRP